MFLAGCSSQASRVMWLLGTETGEVSGCRGLAWCRIDGRKGTQRQNSRTPNVRGAASLKVLGRLLAGEATVQLPRRPRTQEEVTAVPSRRVSGSPRLRVCLSGNGENVQRDSTGLLEQGAGGRDESGPLTPTAASPSSQCRDRRPGPQ